MSVITDAILLAAFAAQGVLGMRRAGARPEDDRRLPAARITGYESGD